MLFLILSISLATVTWAQQQATGGTDQSARIVNYLLGMTNDDTGLDVNGDTQVTVADVIYSIAHRAPAVSSLAIAGGIDSTNTPVVTLNNTCTNNPAYYMASESLTFSGAAWKTYTTAPSFTLSTGNLTKTVYFKVKTAFGVESTAVTDTITLTEINPLTVGAAAMGGHITPVGDADWWSISVTTSSTYLLETFPGTLTDNYMRLFGPGNMNSIIDQDHNSSVNGTARIALTLAPGKYYVKVQAYVAGGTGSYTIRMTNIGGLKVDSFSINSGALMATGRSVMLNNTCTGVPTHYMASESSIFSDATWKTYDATPAFSLSAGNLAKRVYFKVKDNSGVESGIVSDTITLSETTTLTVGAAAVTGNISPAGETDWWRFVVDATSTYAVETWPGTLADNTLSLYGPDSMTTLVSSDDDSGTGNAAKLALTLRSGTYYVRIQAASAGNSGDYTIEVSTLGALKINSFSVNSGVGLATDRTVTLNNACVGAPTHYKASESSSFSGASWRTYATAPTFILSSDNESKRVYFKVKDLSGTESVAVSDSIALKEMIALPADGTIVDGDIAKEDEEDWFLLTISTGGLYTIQTYAGSLADTALSVADEPDPDDDEWLIENDDIDDSDLMSQATVWLAAGAYYVRIKAADASTGTYNIRAWPPANKKLSVNGSTVTGNISSSTDIDWYQFTVTSAGTYSIETEADELEDGMMELYSNSFQKIAINDDGSASSSDSMPAISASLAAGTYIIRFVGASSEDTGSYTINVRNGAISGGIIALAIDGPTAGGVISEMDDDGTIDVDRYQIVVTDGDSYTITTTAGTLETAYMTLLDEDGAVITAVGSSYEGEMPEVEDIDLEPGVYYVTVQGYSYTDDGSYKIRVQD